MTRRRPRRPTVSKAQAADLLARLPQVPQLKHLRLVAAALGDADEYGWAGSVTAVSLRVWLLQFFRRARLGVTGVAGQLAAVLDEHGRSRSEADRLMRQGLDIPAEVYRERQRAAWSMLTREFGLELRNRVDPS